MINPSLAFAAAIAAVTGPFIYKIYDIINEITMTLPW